MGEVTPPIWPPYDPEKWYLINVKTYEDGDGVCVNYLFDQWCCQSGQTIINWLPDWCLQGHEVCILANLFAQEIISYFGPYDTIEECEDDLP